jgi:drug/metabolite transporter (DMT)-like permease
MYYLPIILTIIANIFYHVSQKFISSKINPFFSLMITYGIAFIACSLILAITKQRNPIKTELQYINWAPIVLGFAIVLLEIGYLLAYRMHWKISTASIISTIVVVIALIPIGKFIFHEEISSKNIFGIIVSIIGIILMNSR